MWLTLGLERQDFRVQRPWGATLKQEHHQPQPLPGGTRVLAVFEQTRRQLLILGEPGSGKTTMLLELAQDLFKLAQADQRQPIPVLVNLSSWKDPTQSILAWLLGELQRKYGLRPDLAREYLKHNQLLPLLDGLDEVATAHQRACAVAINDWLTADLEGQPGGVVVCCRREEFERVVREPLSLYGAIYLQALTPGQISDYFGQFGLAAVDRAVQQDAGLSELLTKPLFLSMFGLVAAQGQFDGAAWQGQATARAQVAYLFDRYWEAVMARDLITDPAQRKLGRLSQTYGRRKVPSRAAVRRALVFAAKSLAQESETELLIERMQPSWLLNAQEKSLYQLIYVATLTYMYTKTLSAITYSPYFSMWLGALVFTFPYLKYLIARNSIIPAERLSLYQLSIFLKESFSKEGNYAGRIVLSGISIFLMLSAHVIKNINLVWVNLLAVVISGILINSFIRWLFSNIRAAIEIPLKANQGIKNTWQNILLFLVIVLFFSTLLIIRFYVTIGIFVDNQISLQVIVAYIIYIAGYSAFEGGGNALLQHFCLRLVLWQNRYAPPRYDKLLDYCTERLLLQRIGGRYRFMHKLLQDHFAAMDLD